VFIDPAAEAPDDSEEYFVADLSPQVESGGRVLIIEPTQPTFTPGRPGRMRLENLSDRMIGYNLCFNHFFERQVSGRWEALPRDQDLICSLVVHGLSPGTTQEDDVPIPGTIPSGRYRVVFRSIEFLFDWVLLPRADRTSAPFEID
jgi:hypothetical protein